MKIALLGYGKMGKAIEELAVKAGDTVVLRVDSSRRAQLSEEELQLADVVIEFTKPSAVAENLLFCLRAGVPVVSGTTGWQHEWVRIRDEFQTQGGSLMHASNFSIGVNLLWEMNRLLAGWMNRYPEYKPALYEVHHTRKIDSPSGTAVTLATDLIKRHKATHSYHLEKEGEVAPGSSLPIQSLREGDVIGIHEVHWTSPADRISISHEAYSRTGFAEGALMAARWLIGRKGVYSMSDLLFGTHNQ